MAGSVAFAFAPEAEHARWWWETMSTGGVDLRSDDLELHYTETYAAMHGADRERWVETMRGVGAASLLGATMMSARVEMPNRAIVEYRTPSGLHLEVHLPLDPAAGHRLAGIAARRLAGGGSQTALGAAAARAAHLEVQGGTVLRDTFARSLAGEVAEGQIAALRRSPLGMPLDLFLSVRSRLAEDTLALKHAQGVQQYVLLGAGLDSYAYRQPPELADVRVFEVDHPSSQRWKRHRVATCGIVVPGSVSYVAVDFENDDLDRQLAKAGFDASAPSMIAWLGVTYYLTEEAIAGTLACLGSWSAATIVFDYLVPEDQWEFREPWSAAWFRAQANAKALAGEPWISHFTPSNIEQMLVDRGFDSVEHVASDAIAGEFLSATGLIVEPRLRLVRASTVASP